MSSRFVTNPYIEIGIVTVVKLNIYLGKSRYLTMIAIARRAVFWTKFVS